MLLKAADVTVAGHICLDVIPEMRSNSGSLNEIFQPGKLIEVGGAITATGGAVSNTGLALHRLGVPTQLMGKVGDDLFGNAILDLLNRIDSGLSDSMIVSPGEPSSYSIVISPPDVDRVFLHCTGTNDTCTAADFNMNKISSSRLFHFGYPPLMKRMYEEEGRELAKLLAGVKRLGVTVTLDMAKPDPHSDAGQVDWIKILNRVLPHVDFFLPSFEEILFMLDREEYERLTAIQPHGDIIRYATRELLARLSGSLLEMGAAAILIKLGEHGVYLRTSSDHNRWLQTGKCAPVQLEGWLGRELLTPVFQVNVIGTTGAGDSTIAGFLTGILNGYTLEEAMIAAVAVGGCSVEHFDATSGIPKWEQLQERLSQGWKRHSMNLKLDAWVQDEDNGFWYGPHDKRRLER